MEDNTNKSCLKNLSALYFLKMYKSYIYTVNCTTNWYTDVLKNDTVVMAPEHNQLINARGHSSVTNLSL